MTRKLFVMLVLAAAVLALSACGGGGGNSGGTDSDADSDTDADSDADTDTDTDTGADSGTDAGADAGTDTDTDTDADLCLDVCVHGEVNGDTGEVCTLWQPSTGTWEELEDGDGLLENRARHHTSWLRSNMEPAGGVMSAIYADESLAEVVQYGNIRDSAIWTGTYLAAEALRYLTDGHPEALAHVEEQVRVLHRWFNISGDPGYLARYAAPADSPPAIQAIFAAADAENHLDWEYESGSWHWKGHTSRDQYQGPLLGYSLAYEASEDEATRELIRDDVVELVEQLMLVQPHDVALVISGVLPTPITIDAIELDFQYTVFAPSESDSASPEIVVDVDDLEGTTIQGFQEFYPDLQALLSQVPVLSFLPSIPRASSAIMLSSYFLVALQVTDGVPAYAERRAAIEAFYEGNVDDWLDVAESWSFVKNCGAKYYGNHIAFEPMYNLARLEYDAVRRERIRLNVLKNQMWDTGVADHKNVFFAFVRGANPPIGDDVSALVAFHAEQLTQFPQAPLVEHGTDLSALYAADPECEGMALEAVDVGLRALNDYMWQDNPWHLYGDPAPNRTLNGLDYILAYWLGRYHGFLEKDDPIQCLRWQ